MSDKEEVQKILDKALEKYGIRSYYRRKKPSDKDADGEIYLVYRRFQNYPTRHGDGISHTREVGYDISLCYSPDSNEDADKNAEKIIREIIRIFVQNKWFCTNEGTDGNEAGTDLWEIRVSFTKEGVWQ